MGTLVKNGLIKKKRKELLLHSTLNVFFQREIYESVYEGRNFLRRAFPWHTFKKYPDEILLFQSWGPHLEVYSEPCETSDIGNGGKPLAVLAKRSVLDVWQEYASGVWLSIQISRKH